MAQSRARNLCIAAVACIAVLAGGSLLLKTPSPTPSGTDSTQQTQGTDANLPEPLLVQELTEADPSYSLDDAAARADLIVTGTIVSEGASLLVKPVHEDADPRFFTDRTFKVDSVLKGSPAYSKGKGITLRTRADENVRRNVKRLRPRAKPGRQLPALPIPFQMDLIQHPKETTITFWAAPQARGSKLGRATLYVNPSELEDIATSRQMTSPPRSETASNGDEDSNSGAQATIESRLNRIYQNGSLSERRTVIAWEIA